MSGSPTKLTAGHVPLPGGTATLVVAARPGRKKVILAVDSNVGLWIGPDNTVAVNAGFLFNSDFNGSREFETQDAIYACTTGSGASGVSFLEFHD